MPVIHLVTHIKAPIERCFDLSRSVELHTISTSNTNERAVAGVTSGLIGPGQAVTWRARHFGIYQDLTSEVTDYMYPSHFKSRMIKGAFKKIDHTHLFHESNGITTMEDHFDFEAPFGVVGNLVARYLLVPYMKKFLEQRNETIKSVAESDQWKSILPDTHP